MDTLFNTSFNEAQKTHMRNEIEIFESCYELEEKGVKLRMNLVEVLGFGDQMQRDESMQPLVLYLVDQHENYLMEETRAVRALHECRDTRIHVCLYFVTPKDNHLKSFDIIALKALCPHVNLIPIIAKADTLSRSALEELKENIRQDMAKHGISCYELPTNRTESEDGIVGANTLLKTFYPFAVCGSRTVDTSGRRVRQYPWGAVEVDNENHNDFIRLRDAIIRLNMTDLLKKTHDVFYAKYREERLPEIGLSTQEGEDNVEDEGFEEKLSKLRQDQSRQVDHQQQEMREMFALRIREKESELRAQQKMIETRYEAELDKLQQEKERYSEKLAAVAKEYDEMQSGVTSSPHNTAAKKKKSFFTRSAAGVD